MLSRKRYRGTSQDYKKGEISTCPSKLWTNRNVFSFFVDIKYSSNMAAYYDNECTSCIEASASQSFTHKRTQCKPLNSSAGTNLKVCWRGRATGT